MNGIGTLVAGLPYIISAIGMYLARRGIEIVVPQNCKQALSSTLIMPPPSDLIGMTRQSAVLVYQPGDGIGNILCYPAPAISWTHWLSAGAPW